MTNIPPDTGIFSSVSFPLVAEMGSQVYPSSRARDQLQAADIAI